MYLQTNKSKGKNGKIYTAYFLCHKYRDNGKIKTKVLANLSKLPIEIIMSIGNLLKHGKDALVQLSDIIVEKSIDYGLVFLIIFLMKRLRIRDTLQKTVPEISARLELIIIGKIVTRGSKLGIYNWIYRNPKVAEKLEIGISKLKTDDLYQALGSASFNRNKIERKWFVYHKDKAKDIFLYDITSTYFEGTENELSAFGYNRDGKKGKMQINIGLITNNEGFPLKVEVFRGNLNDQKTVVEQLTALKKEFGAEHLIFVGDRGMKIKYNLDSMEDDEKTGIDYITGLERSEIEQLINDDVIQLSLFRKELAEIIHPQGRYVLSVNPKLAERDQKFLLNKQIDSDLELSEIKQSWEKRKNQNLENIQKLKAGHKNKKLVTEFKQKKLDGYIVRCAIMLKKNKTKKYYTISVTNEEFKIDFDREKFNKAILLSGKYVISTSIEAKQMDKKDVRENYRNLHHVEHAFRDFKSDNIQIRPVYHRNEAQTRGHVLISMFSYAIVKEMENKIFPFLKLYNKQKKRQLAYDDVMEELKDIKMCILDIPKTTQVIKFTELNKFQSEILKLFGMTKKQLEKDV